ncbi:hypothetical protein TVVG_00019 [Tetraselmis viridis virus SI1]|uniref:head closure Hc1 n=1 Tax=Tetraselmis viridis virus S20 TaxID=754070 RepID=UPI0002C0B0F1|nr:head closure Hc1 [Tetraselmis viridis virus S20]AGH31368.1 hypothetical protein TVGG_00040 [Tetraselmis viridis virus S20]AGH31402.1 hypothetical protein TVVG_00019 [Tetraselmis viridis virus SI1]
MTLSVGQLNRRLQFQEDVGGKDAAGDHVEDWRNTKRRWAAYRARSMRERMASQQVLRDSDTEFTVRDDTFTRAIAPETMRIIHRGQIFEIVGIQPTQDLEDGLVILASSRPDKRGARAPQE